MNFAFSAEQEQLRESVRDYLAREAPVAYARAMMDDPAGFSEESWRSLAKLGWLGLTIPERFGGSGLGALELGLLLEEMGGVVFPGPFFATVCLGVATLLAAGSDAQQAEMLPEVAEGRRRLTLAVAEASGSWEAAAVEASAEQRSGSWVLSGTKLFVPDARTADTIFVAARSQRGVGLWCVPRDANGVRVEPMTTVDATRKLDVVELAGVTLPSTALLGESDVSDASATVLDALVDRAKTALAAEMCGAAAAALALSVECAKIRKQFDRPIGAFQAIQHKLADMKVALETARDRKSTRLNSSHRT